MMTRLLFFLLLVLAAVACGRAQTTEPVTAAGQPAAPTTAPVNLARLKWYASADLPPTASPEQIRASATPTTPIITLRMHPGGSATLFTVIELPKPARKPSPAEIVIGDIDGADETFLNGTKIGATSEWGGWDSAIPRTYAVPAKVLREGENVLAIRIGGAWGHGTFGLRQEPLVFAYVAPDRYKMAEFDPGDRLHPAGVPGIDETDAVEAIRQAEADAFSSSPLVRKRPSFGRFGLIYSDGLPSGFEAGPTCVAHREAPRFNVALDAVSNVSIASGKNEPGIDGWHKLARVIGHCSQKPVRYTMLQHLFYPGAVATIEQGGTLQMRVTFPHGEGVVHSLNEEEFERVFPNSRDANFSAHVFFEPRKDCVPAVLAVSGMAANVVQADKVFDVTFSRAEKPSQPTKVYLFFPTGLGRADFSSRPGSFLDAAAATDNTTEPLWVARRWFRLGLNEPVAADEYFQSLPQTETIRVHQVARYEAPRGLKIGLPMLCPPPQAVFARDAIAYPASFPPLLSTGVTTFSGDLFCADEVSTRTGNDGLRVLSYTLPLPPMHERALLELPAHEPLKQLLNASFSDMATTTAGSGVDVFYKGRTQGYQAYSYLSPENRKALTDNSSVIVPQALKNLNWFESAEPLSGMKFWWSHFIEGPYFGRYDLDWGNGLSLYGLYTYVKYAGDWELVAKNWEPVEKMFAWFTVADDWEWMRASNAIHGHGTGGITGAGASASATHAAALAYARLARGAGRDEDSRYGLYMAARTAVLAVSRFAYDDYARKHTLKVDESVTVGFLEGLGFLVGELNRYPWNITSNISGHGVQPENFDLYLARIPDRLREYERLFEQSYPDWSNGAYVYPFPTRYGNNSGYITLPHIYLRARLRVENHEMLAETLRRARTNTQMWWLAPPVAAEVMNMRVDSYVADWGRCGFLGGTIKQDGKRRQVDAQFSNGYAPDMVELAVPRQPAEVQINAGLVPLTDSRYENGVLQLRLRRNGVNSIMVVY